jgi:hypothetical protein
MTYKHATILKSAEKFIFLPCSLNVQQETFLFPSPCLSSPSVEDKVVGIQLNFGVSVLRLLNHHPGMDMQ